MSMNTKTIVLALAIAAATAVMATIAPIATLNAMADPPDRTTSFCVHNGNGRIQDSCSGSSGSTTTCTRNTEPPRGQFTCTTN